MNSRQKGMRAERRAVKELEEQGWKVYRVKGSTRFNKNVDIFGLYDLLCLSKAHGQQHRLWIQVKTNKKIYGKDLKPFKDFKKKYCDKEDTIQIWTWWNRGKRKKVGWEIRII